MHAGSPAAGKQDCCLAVRKPLPGWGPAVLRLPSRCASLAPHVLHALPVPQLRLPRHQLQVPDGAGAGPAPAAPAASSSLPASLPACSHTSQAAQHLPGECLHAVALTHGTSCFPPPPAPRCHLQAAHMLGKPEEETNLVICHLGAGSSMCAVQVGLSCSSQRRAAHLSPTLQPSTTPSPRTQPSATPRTCICVRTPRPFLEPPPPAAERQERGHHNGADASGGPDDGHALR